MIFGIQVSNNIGEVRKILKESFKRTSMILLLTVDYLSQKMITKSLMLEGYNVKLAQDPQQALDKVRTEAIDVILVDEVFIVNLSTDSEFISKLKQESHRASIILMVTPDTEKKSQIHKLLSSGSIENCIFKPFLPQSLISLVSNLITKKQRKLKKAESRPAENAFATERRKLIRGNIPVEILYSFIDKLQEKSPLVEQKTKTKDFSAEGMRLDVEKKMQVSQYVELKILLPSEKAIQVTGQVVWEKENIPKDTKSLGIHFIDLPPQDGQIISNHIMLK